MPQKWFTLFNLAVCSEIQGLQRNMTAPPTALVERGESESRLQCEQGLLDNGQYLDIRGVAELEANPDSKSSTNTTTNTSTTTITTTATAAENSSSSTPNHSKFKSPDQHSKGPVQFDQPNRWHDIQFYYVHILLLFDLILMVIFVLVETEWSEIFHQEADKHYGSSAEFYDYYV